VYSEATVKVRLLVAYVGTDYAGWQRQPNAVTVQQRLEEALAGLAGAPVATVGAGRTDAGVHARGQVVSLALDRELPDSALVHGVNHRLPADIRVLAAASAPPGFDARRSARAKEYRYRFHRSAVPPPDRAPFVVPAPPELDVAAMIAATRALVGRHDFAAFASAGGVPGPTERTIFAASWSEEGPELTLSVCGEGFLRGMVRALAGTLLEVGLGRRSGAQLARLLAGAERSAAGPTAPARGLTLERVDYAGEAARPPAGAAAGVPPSVR
jgi:tRNA pseudouridine38-40 synthase